MCVWGVGGGGSGGEAYAASQTTVLHRKRFNQTESPICVVLCVLCFQRLSFFTFILLHSYYCRNNINAVMLRKTGY